MKKTIAIVVSLALALGMMFSVLPAGAADEETEYVRFTAQGGDPYADFSFSADGANQTINPDVVKYAAIRYKTAASVDSEGKELVGQLYISPAAEPYVPVKYNFSGEWETVIVDCTAVSAGSTESSAWNSASYTRTSVVRFDPISAQKAEDFDDGVAGCVNVGDYIDVAWIAFFENEADAKAYTGSESTPYCFIDVDGLANPSGVTQLGAQKVSGGVAEATPVPVLDTTYGMTNLFEGGDGAGNITEGLSTGYWLNPIVSDESCIRVEFEAPTAFKGIKMFAYTPKYEVNMIVDIYDENENLLWEGTLVTCGDSYYEFNFGDTVIPAGYTMIDFIAGDNTAHEGDAYFVLGSAPEREDMDEIVVNGANTNEDTQLGVAISLCNAEAPATAAPTAEPTATPAPTAAPTAAPTTAPTAEPEKSGCGSVIGGSFAVIGAMAVAVVAMKKKH